MGHIGHTAILKGLVISCALAAGVVFAYVAVQDRLVGYLMPVKAAACAPDQNLVNPCRPWLGAWAAGYPQAASGVKSQILYHESRIGRQVDLVKDYKTQGGVLSNDDKYFINRTGTYAVITWKPADSFGAGMGGNATVNSDIDKMADSVKSVAPRKLFLSIWHEPENDVSPGTSGCANAQGNAGSPSQYRAMWQNVRNRFEAKGVSNVVWTFIPMGYSGWDCMEKDMWPGNNLVDWIMWDPYESSDSGSWDKTISRFYNWMSANADSSRAYMSKAWGIAETSTHMTGKAAAAGYWEGARAALEANTFPRLKAYIVFDSDNGKPDNRIMYWCDPGTAGNLSGSKGTCGNLQIDTNEQNAYRAFAGSYVFTDAGGGSNAVDTALPTASISTPPDGATVSGTFTISAQASDNQGIAKVVFTVDGNPIGTDMSAPYDMQWDTRQVANGSHVIRAKAYDLAGNTKTPQKTVTVSNTGSAGAAPVIRSFTANPASLAVGGKATLSWSVSNAASCSVSPNGPQGTAASSWVTPAYVSSGARTYSLTCSNSAGQLASSSLAVSVAAASSAPAKPSFAADKASVARGSNTVFTWSSAGAVSCVLNPGGVIATGSSGSKVITNLQQTTTYTLECMNGSGRTAADPVTVAVSDAGRLSGPIILSFTAEPSKLPGAGTSTLRWTTANVASNGCNLSPGPLTSASASGQWTTPTLRASVSFTLTCKGPTDAIASASVSISVNGTPLPEPPAPAPPAAAATSDPLVRAFDGRFVINAQSSDRVKRGQLVTLDPSNVLDAEKIKSISRVEYYDGERLLQTVASPPYAFDTRDMPGGVYSLTERVYYQDGSMSERTQNITVIDDIKEAAATSAGSQQGPSAVQVAVGTAAGATVTAGVLLLGRRWWLPRLRLHWSWLDRFLSLHG